MSGVNKVIAIGNLGADPEVRYLQDGTAVANMSVAVTETWKDKGGEKKERTEWIRCSLFGRQAEVAGEYLKKGAKVYVEGRMRTRKWQDREGTDRYTTEVHVDQFQMLGGGRQDRGGETREPASEEEHRSAPQPARQGAFDNLTEDDIPF